MTVNNQQYKQLYATNGVAVEFPFNFKVNDPDWIRCFLAEDPLIAPVEVENFTVALNPDQGTAAGGTVTFDVPVPTGILAVARVTPITQELDYTAYDAFPAESHEGGMDKLTYSQQWTLGEIARGVRYAYVTDFEDIEWITLEKYVGAGQILYWKDENTLSSAAPSDPILDLATLTYVDAQDEALQSQITAQGITIGSNTGRITVNEGDIADLQNDKADQSVQMVSGTTDMMSITDPSLDSDVTFDFRRNIANGTVQLDEFGFVPSAHLPPTGGLRLFGLWDATGGDNPGDVRPDLEPYRSGDAYITGEGGGTIDLLDPVTGLYVPTVVIEGDLLIYVVNYDVSVIGWVKGSNVDTGTVSAASVTFTPVGDITSVNVQDGMEELDTNKETPTGAQAKADAAEAAAIADAALDATGKADAAEAAAIADAAANYLALTGGTLSGALNVTGDIVATGDITAFSGTAFSNQALAARVEELETQIVDVLARLDTLENP